MILYLLYESMSSIPIVAGLLGSCYYSYDVAARHDSVTGSLLLYAPLLNTDKFT